MKHFKLCVGIGFFLWAGGSVLLTHSGYCQFSLIPEPDGQVSPEQQLMLEQVDELLVGSQVVEALALIDRLKYQSNGLVRYGQVQRCNTQAVQVYRTLRDWCRLKQVEAFASDRALAREYGMQWNSQAEAAFNALQQSKDERSGEESVAQFHYTDAGSKLARLWVDILLEKGLVLAAMKYLDDYFTDWTRVDLSLIAGNESDVSIPWYRAWQAIATDSIPAKRLLELWQSQSTGQPELCGQIISRQLIAAAVSPELLDLDATIRWSKIVNQHSRTPSETSRIQETASFIQDWSESNSVLLSPDFDLSRWPDWQVPVESYSNAYDLTPATLPRVGQRDRLLPIVPAVHDGKVFINDLTRIRAFELESGQSWPRPATEQPLFDSQIAPEAYIPLGYPTQGSPRGRVTVTGSCLYARMGTPVTAWANRIRSGDGSSVSFLVGIDLDSQGKLLYGFPRHLLDTELANAEFDGSPVSSGSMLIATVTQRDHSSIRRRLVAFDRFNGRLKWISDVLGSGIVVGSHRANLISHVQPVVASGLVYLASDLGTVACLNAQTGTILWIAGYQRNLDQASGYPRPNRFRYRDGNPCRIHKGLVFCMPQDCAELFALDVLTGDLVWSTNEIDAADCTYVVGLLGDTVIIAGDRIVWLNCLDGKIVGRYPASTTPGTVNSLPQPRGLGQAVLIGDQVYWPSTSELTVFAADLASRSNQNGSPVDFPTIVKRYFTGVRGADGGNLVSVDNWLLMATPSRLFCLQSE